MEHQIVARKKIDKVWATIRSVDGRKKTAETKTKEKSERRIEKKYIWESLGYQINEKDKGGGGG